MPSLRVRARALQREYAYGETIDLEVTVKNVSRKRLYVVTVPKHRHYGAPYMWRISARRIGVMLAEADLPPGFCYYSYAPPELLVLTAGASRVIPVPVGMPPREGRIENNVYVWAETPVSGQITIDLSVGFLRQKFPADTSATWAEFLSLQEKSPTVPVKVRVKRK